MIVDEPHIAFDHSCLRMTLDNRKQDIHNRIGMSQRLDKRYGRESQITFVEVWTYSSLCRPESWLDIVERREALDKYLQHGPCLLKRTREN